MNDKERLESEAMQQLERLEQEIIENSDLGDDSVSEYIPQWLTDTAAKMAEHMKEHNKALYTWLSADDDADRECARQRVAVESAWVSGMEDVLREIGCGVSVETDEDDDYYTYLVIDHAMGQVSCTIKEDTDA